MPAPVRPIAYAEPHIVRHDAPDGSSILRSTVPLLPYDPSLARLFRAAVERNPEGLFLAERNADAAWRELTYEDAHETVDALAQGLIERGLSAERPVMILSGNSVDHALLTLAGHTAGIPVAPISVAYSLQSQDHAKLKHIAALLKPGLIYVADTGPFAKSLAALDLADVEIVASRNGANLANVTLFDDLAETRPGPALERAMAAIGARHHRQVPVHLGIDRPAERRDQHPRHAHRQPAADRADLAVRRPKRRSNCSTGCRGTTPSAATTTSTWCCATPARSTSTAAGRCRA